MWVEMFLLLIQTSVPLDRILLPCVTKMRATFVKWLLWAMPCVKHFIHIGLLYLLKRQFHELSTSRGNKVSEKFSNCPKVAWLVNSGVRVSTWQTNSSCSQKITRTCTFPHLEPGLLDFADEFRQFYDVFSCPACYLGKAAKSSIWSSVQVCISVLLRKCLHSTPCGQAWAF